MSVQFKEQITIPGEVVFGIGVDHSPLFGHCDAFVICEDAVRILIEWCSANCHGDWQVDITPPTTFRFEKSKDAIFFKMTWL